MLKKTLTTIEVALNIDGQCHTVYLMYDPNIEDNLKIDIRDNKLTVELEDTALTEDITDPARSMYQSDEVTVTGRNLIAKQLSDQKQMLLRSNKLDLSNIDFGKQKFDFLLSPEIDLSCIRVLDVSCDSGKGNEYDADSFLRKLFDVPSLCSLEIISVGSSNVTVDTLKILKDKGNFSGNLIRNRKNVNHCNGRSIASIYITNIDNTPIMQASFEDKRKLQQTASNQLNILYRDHNYERGTAHLQLVLN